MNCFSIVSARRDVFDGKVTFFDPIIKFFSNLLVLFVGRLLGMEILNNGKFYIKYFSRFVFSVASHDIT